MEQFRRGESVTLRDAAAPTLGRIVSVSADGSRVTVTWHVRPGHEHETTGEDATALRLAHESEIFENQS